MVLVLGAGAIGSLLASEFSRAGTRVTLVDSWHDNVAALNSWGLSVKTPQHSYQVRVAAVHDQDLATAHTAGHDLAVVAVKAYDTARAFGMLERAGWGSRPIVHAQNGRREMADRESDPTSLVPSVVTMNGELIGPGSVVRYNDPVAGTLVLPAGSRFHGHLHAAFAGVSGVTFSEDFEAIEASKFMLNVMSNGLAGLAGLRTADLWQTAPWMDAIVQTARELAELLEVRAERMAPLFGSLTTRELLSAAAPGHDEWKRCLDRLRVVGRSREGPYNNPPSLLQDLRRGRPTEVAYLNGWVVRAGAQQGIPTPMNEFVLERVRAIESGMRRVPIRSEEVLSQLSTVFGS